MDINISVSGDKQAQDMLQNLEHAVNDLSPEMSDLGDRYMKLYSGEVYDTEGAAINHEWAPLSPSYALEKAKRWGSAKILVASGFMKENYHLDTGANHVLISNPTPYAPIHQNGGGRTPQRILMDFSSQEIDFITNTILNGIIGRLGV